jgi:hypothetical protein
MTQKLIDTAIQKKLDQQLEQLRLMTQLLMKGTNVNIDGDKVATAQKKAAMHARRP